MLKAKQHILSNYGVESTMDLSELELDDAIERLQIIESQKKNTADYEVRKWRHKCLRAMSRFIDTQDWGNVNSFMLNKRVAGKHLYELSAEELQVLHRKINKIGDVFQSRERMINRQAFMN